MRGKLITFEGGEGCGKTTQIYKLKEMLENYSIECVVSREPGGIPISEKIREILLDPNNHSMDKLTELLLFMASRRQNVEEFVRPNISKGVWVLCDRFMDSSIVYQGICRGLGISLVESLHNIVLEGMMPDLTLVLDIDAEKGVARAIQRGALSRLDKETIKFHQNVRAGFSLLCEKYPNRVYKINANQDIEIVARDISLMVYNKLLNGIISE